MSDPIIARGLSSEGGAAPGDDAPRWPGAPEAQVEDGEVVNGKFECVACGEASTLVYRCSECGAEPGGGDS